MNDSKNKSIVVVGGSSGMGLQLSLNLKENGAEVFVWSRNSHPDLDNKDITFTQLDVSRPFEDPQPKLPPVLHGLVYCPGSIRLTPFRALKDEDFMEDFNLNVLGAVRVIRFCLPSLQKAENASIVLVSTVAVRIGMKFHASVGVAKAAVEGLTRSLAAEFSAKGLRVNAVAPSLTNTPLAERLLSTKEKREAAARRHPLERFGEPADIANMMEFLLSDQSSWITGQVLSVDGGMSSIKHF